MAKWYRRDDLRVRDRNSVLRAELDHVGDLVVLGIDNYDLLRGKEEPVALHLRHLLRHVSWHGPRGDALRDRIANLRLDVVCVGLHVFDEFSDRMTLFE